jgi:hypothetical protein
MSGAAAAAATESITAGSGAEAPPGAPSTHSPSPTPRAATPGTPELASSPPPDVARPPPSPPLSSGPDGAAAAGNGATPAQPPSSGAWSPPLLGLVAWYAGATPEGPGASPLGVLGPSLSPAVAPFFPGRASRGRSKQRRWEDDDGEETDDDYPTTYLEAAHRPMKTTHTSPVRPMTRVGCGRVDAVQGPLQGHAARGQARHCRPRPQLVHGLPVRPMDSRVPARQRFDRCGRVSAPDTDGWREILPQLGVGSVAASTVPRPSQ